MGLDACICHRHSHSVFSYVMLTAMCVQRGIYAIVCIYIIGL